jgi:hypothetical protein
MRLRKPTACSSFRKLSSSFFAAGSRKDELYEALCYFLKSGTRGTRPSDSRWCVPLTYRAFAPVPQ